MVCHRVQPGTPAISYKLIATPHFLQIEETLQLRTGKADEAVSTIAVMAQHDHWTLEDDAKTGDN